MLVFVNGQFVPEEKAVISVFDRSFLYGDGLFETLRVSNGQPFRWTHHLQRLQQGAEFLGIHPPFTTGALRSSAGELISRNEMPEALLRLTLSRGVGVRGYAPRGARQPSLVMSLHQLPAADSNPPAWRLVTSLVRLPAHEPLAQFKTCNKLPQILARAEADARQADEALLLNSEGFVVEAASSNLFWLKGNTVCTPPLAGGILPGVTRATVLEVCRSLAIEVGEVNVLPTGLLTCDGVFLTLSSLGVVSAASLDGQGLPQSPMVGRLRNAYGDLLQRETSGPPPVAKS